LPSTSAIVLKGHPDDPPNNLTEASYTEDRTLPQNLRTRISLADEHGQETSGLLIELNAVEAALATLTTQVAPTMRRKRRAASYDENLKPVEKPEAP
jgi:hypothetical protein